MTESVAADEGVAGPAAASPTERPCLNCGDETTGHFCPVCGQRKREHRASVAALMAAAVQDQLSLTSELPRTLRALFLHPGFLTREYSVGRIARYIPPLRLYLVASLLFFLILSLRTGRDAPPTVRSPVEIADSIRRDSMRQDYRDRAAARGDTATRSMVTTPFEGLNARLAERSRELQKLPEEERQEKLRVFLIQRAPTVVFLLLPFFALLLKVFYWRTRRYYAEHFVFALHAHAFGFLIFAFILALPRGSSLKFPVLALMAWLAGYLYVALKRVYDQGWIWTAAKFMVIGFTYFIMLLMGFTIEVIAAVLLV